MRKIQGLLVALFLMLAFVSPSFAEIGVKKDGVPNTIATDIDFRSMGDAITSDGSTLTFNLMLAGFGNGGQVSMATSDLAVSTSYGFTLKAISSTVGAAGTLANGVPGQLLTIYISARTGSGTYILTPTTKTGYTSITFDAVADSVTLLYVSDSVGWVPVASSAVSFT